MWGNSLQWCCHNLSFFDFFFLNSSQKYPVKWVQNLDHHIDLILLPPFLPLSASITCTSFLHLRYGSRIQDISWYPDWALQLKPLLSEKDFGHCWALSLVEVCFLSYSWQTVGNRSMTHTISINSSVTHHRALWWNEIWCLSQVTCHTYPNMWIFGSHLTKFCHCHSPPGWRNFHFVRCVTVTYGWQIDRNWLCFDIFCIYMQSLHMHCHI